MKAPEDGELALPVNGAAPYVWFGTTKVIAGVAAEIVNVVVALPAAHVPEAAWFVVMLTVPTPVIVTLLPVTVAGPLLIT